MGDTLCSDLFDAWEKAYEDWEHCQEELGEVKEDYWKAVAAVEIACAGTVATAETIVGGVVGGAACAATLWNMYDAADDLFDKIDRCNELNDECRAAAEEYKECVSSHKHDPDLVEDAPAESDTQTDADPFDWPE